MFALSCSEMQRVPGNMPKAVPNQLLNASGANSNPVNYQSGQPYPVLRSKWGFERVQG